MASVNPRSAEFDAHDGDDGDGILARLRMRAAAQKAIRAFFDDQGFLECDTPMLVPGPGLEPHIDPLSVPVRLGLHDAPTERFLHTSPELALKRVVAAGAPRVYQLARVFRDGERTSRHLPEFTMLEWYRAGTPLTALIDDTRALLVEIARALDVKAPFDLRAPFRRVSVAELFRDHADVDLSAALDEMHDGNALALVERSKRAGHHLRHHADFEDAFFHIMGTCIEPHIGQDAPVVVERWPAEMAVLARTCDDDARYAERFEIYVHGLELANAFDELTDAAEQRRRFESDNRVRQALNKRTLPLDEEFLGALFRMPRTVGIALGVDRVLMALTGALCIDDVTVLPFR